MAIVKNPSLEPRASIVSVITAEMASSFVLFAGIAVLPLVSLTMLGLAPDISKKFFLIGVLVATVALWLVGRLQEGIVRIPRTLAVAAVGALPLAFIIAGIFSDNIRYGLIGPLYLPGTALSILIFAVIFVAAAILFDSRQKIFNFYLALSFVGIIAAVYYLAVLIIGGIFVPGIFAYLPQSLLGKWYEASVFFGFTAMIALFMLELTATGTSRLLKWVSVVSLVLSLIMLVLTNFIAVWVVIGFIALMTFVYAISLKSPTGEVSPAGFLEGKKVFRASFFVMLLALLFLILGRQGGLLNDYLNSTYARLNVSFVDVRPGWTGTALVGKEVLTRDPLTGIGPSNFTAAWAEYKPRLVNELEYWNINFSEAVGTIPTFMVTTGLVGILAWLAWAIALLYLALTAYRKMPADPLSRFLVVLSFGGMVYFWLMSIVYTPVSYGLPMLFISSGIFVASLTAAKVVPQITFSLHANPKHYFAVLLVLVLLLIVTIAAGYILVQKFWSVIVYQDALETAAAGQIDEADALLIKAITLNADDPLYFRTLSNTKLAQLNRLLSASDVNQEDAQALLQNIISAAIASAQEAVNLNPIDYTSQVALGGVYEYLAGLGVPGAYEQAAVVYKKIVTDNPNNPEPFLLLARLEISQENFDEARANLEKALAVKSNYSSSILLLAQLDIEEGGTRRAIERLEAATAAVPNDPSLFFQLGFLRYRLGEYEGAVSAFNRVLTLSPNGINANASYFLGLSYAALDRPTEALEQFELIARFNPDNSEVKQIIRNIQAGRDALSGVTASTNDEDEAPTDESGDNEDTAAAEGTEEADQ